jgi:hypothetical protein
MSAARRPLPKANFFIVGAPKCGTTAWFEYLRSHPDIYFPETKEPCFFAFDLPSMRRVRSEREYSQLFAGSGAAKVVGDASADYLYSATAAKEISAYNGGGRILILLRDQEEYLPALHNLNLWQFWEDIDDFGHAWKLSGERPLGTIPDRCTEPRMLDYSAMGRFCEQVGRYLDEFPAEQILVLHFGDWVDDPRGAYLKVLAFLGLKDDGRVDFPRVNQSISYHSRSLLRLLTFPPPLIRKVARLIKGVTGLKAEAAYAAVRKTIGLLSARGYKQISPELRDEIRLYYAEDNRRLEARLKRAGVWPHQPQTAASELEGQLV